MAIRRDLIKAVMATHSYDKTGSQAKIKALDEELTRLKSEVVGVLRKALPMAKFRDNAVEFYDDSKCPEGCYHSICYPMRANAGMRKILDKKKAVLSVQKKAAMEFEASKSAMLTKLKFTVGPVTQKECDTVREFIEASK